jgi:hypothetical protein
MDVGDTQRVYVNDIKLTRSAKLHTVSARLESHLRGHGAGRGGSTRTSKTMSPAPLRRGQACQHPAAPWSRFRTNSAQRPADARKIHCYRPVVPTGDLADTPKAQLFLLELAGRHAKRVPASMDAASRYGTY